MDPSADRGAAIDVALSEVDRLERTIDDLLALGRDAPGTEARTELGTVLTALENDWHGRSVAETRPLFVTSDPGLPEVAVSARAVRQILDVLVENAIRHGAGVITVRARVAPPGAVVEVSDEGTGVAGEKERIFERRVSTAGRSGIGLALARSLAEAEAGRLVLARSGPGPVFASGAPERSLGVARDCCRAGWRCPGQERHHHPARSDGQFDCGVDPDLVPLLPDAASCAFSSA